MPARCTGFVVVAHKRPSGSSYWMVSGTLGRRQLRREFATRHEAMAFAEARNSELRQVPVDQAPVLTHLKPDQVREAENVTNLRRAHPDAALTDAYDFFHDLAPSLSRTEAARLGATKGEVS